MSKISVPPPRIQKTPSVDASVGPLPADTKPGEVAPGFTPGGAPGPVALEGAQAPQSADPSARLNALWQYSQSHSPGRVEAPGLPQAPALPGKRLLVVNKGPNQGAPGESSIMVMDLESGRMLKKLATEPGPHEVSVAPDGKTAVAPNYGLQTQGTGVETGGGESLTVVDLQKEVASTLRLEGYFRPHGVEWLDSDRVAVTVDAKGRDLSSGYVLEVNVKSGQIERAHRTGQPGSHLVRKSPDGRYLFVSNIQGGSFSRIDRGTSEVKTLKTGRGTEGYDFTPDGKEIWAGNLEENTFSIIDVETFTQKQKLQSPGELPIRFKFVSQNLLLVANRGSNDLSFIDPRTQQPIGKQVKFDLTRFTPEGPDATKTSVPMQIELTPDRKFAFVGNSHSGMVSMVDLKKREVVGYYLAGDKPDPLALYDAPLKPAAVRAAHLQVADDIYRVGMRPKQIVVAPPEQGKPALEAATVRDGEGRPSVVVIVRTSSAEQREGAERTAKDLGATFGDAVVGTVTPIRHDFDRSQKAVFTRALSLADRVLTNAGLDPKANDRQLYRYAMARFLLNGTTPEGLAWLEREWKGGNAELLATGLVADRWRIKIERELEAPYRNAETFAALKDLNGRVTTAISALRQRFPDAQMQFYVAGSPTKGRLGASSDIDLQLSTPDPVVLQAALSKSYMTAPDPNEIFDIGEYEEFVRRGKYFGVPAPIGDGQAVVATPDFLTGFYVQHTRDEWGLAVDPAHPDAPLDLSKDVVEKFVREAPPQSETLYSAARAYRRHVDIAFVAKYLEHLEVLNGVSDLPADRLADYGDELVAERAGGADSDWTGALALADRLGITDLQQRMMVEFAWARRRTRAAQAA